MTTATEIRYTLTPQSKGAWLINDLANGTAARFEDFPAASAEYDRLTGRKTSTEGKP